MLALRRRSKAGFDNVRGPGCGSTVCRSGGKPNTGRGFVETAERLHTSGSVT